MKKIILSVLIFVGVISKTNAQITRMSVSELYEGNTFVGFLGRGGLYTGGWAEIPNAMTLTFASRDFAIGGWRKSDGLWGGARLFINSDNGNVGIGTVSPGALLDVNGKAIVRSSFYTNDIRGYDGGNISIGPNTGGASSTVFMIGGVNASEVMRVNYDKNVGIGTSSPDSKLTVKGKIHAEEVKVDLAVPADYVFEKYYLGQSSLKPDYTLLTLSEVEKFTEANHHLPNVPSAKEIKENGLLLGEMSNILLQKIEELTLYSIDQKKTIEKQAIAIQKLEKENESFKSLSERLTTIEKELKTKK
jgi:hypothetical protein